MGPTTFEELVANARALDFELRPRIRTNGAGADSPDAEPTAGHHVISRGDAFYLEGTPHECAAFLTGWRECAKFLIGRSDPGTIAAFLAGRSDPGTPVRPVPRVPETLDDRVQAEEKQQSTEFPAERGMERDQRQGRTARWAAEAFGRNEATSVLQRGLRLLEEAVEAFQAAGGDEAIAHKLVSFVFARPRGDLGQELGGVAVTVLLLAAAAGLSADEEECREVHRVLSRPLREFSERNAGKNAAGFYRAAGGPMSRDEGPTETSMTSDSPPSSTPSGPRSRSQDVLHVLSQEGQPYGSERRCCNHCGIMIWGGEEPAHVDNWEDWRAAANNCQAMELA